MPTPAQFAKKFEFMSAKLSPDGKHLGIILVKDDKRRLAVVTSDTLKPVGGADFGSKQQVGNFWWANNERLVMQIWQQEAWSEDPVFAGELFAVNYDGKRSEMIFGYRSGEEQVGSRLARKEAVRGSAQLVGLLPNDEEHILITVKPWTNAGLSQKTIHKLNIYDGDLSSIVASTPLETSYVVATDDGIPIVAVGTNEEYEKSVYRYDNGNYVDISAEGLGGAFNVAGLDETGENLIFVDNNDTDTTSLYRMNLASGKRELIYNNPSVDITGLALDSTETVPLAVAIDDGYPSYVLLDSDSDERAIYEHLFNVFKGYSLSITSSDKAEENFVIFAENEIVPGQFYLFSKNDKKLRLLFSNQKHLPSDKLSQSFPFSFEASDGQKIPGYITFPSHIPETENVPMVVLVHGGPEARDYWSYDAEVQMLASMGYAVLRVNFRGSRGYGKAFKHAIRKNWGTIAQQDIIDATNFVINSGGIKRDQVCIMGASFGGYSAVMSATIAPDLFKCVVATAGVYDLEQLIEEGNVAEYLLYGPAYLGVQLGNDPEVLRAQSPVHHVNKLKAPLLLAHGGDDYQVPIAHAYSLKTQLDKHNKPYEWFVIDKAGHSFYEEASKTKYFEAVASFLQKHLD
jgi:dipeptidyl aminopeptidase/acylaminoacyl peptidase